MNSVSRLASLSLLLLLVAPMILVPQTAATSIRHDTDFTPSYGRKTVDDFGYRIYFELSDGVEVLSIRGTFRVSFTYSTDPFFDTWIQRHSLYILLGFYYGKTMLGRNVVKEIKADSIAFYPKWHDSAGYPHDLFPDTPMFALNGSLSDGQLVARSMTLENDAFSSYISHFGGVLLFSGLTLILGDNHELVFDNISIDFEKYNNELDVRDAVLSSSSEISYTSDSHNLRATLEGVTPLIVILDAGLAVALWGLGATFVILAILHVRGRIVLPVDKLKKRILGSSENESG